MMTLLQKFKQTFLRFNKKQLVEFKVKEGKIMSWPCGSIQYEFDVPNDAECLGASPIKDKGIVVCFRLPDGDLKAFIYDPAKNTAKKITPSDL